MKKQAKGPKFSEPVSEHFMRHHYGASGYIAPKTYTCGCPMERHGETFKHRKNCRYWLFAVALGKLAREAGPARGRKRTNET